MKRIAVISCSARSREGVTTAREMYAQSAWFRALLKFTSQRFRVILVSSAKYGLVYLNDLIASYDFNVAHRDPEVREAALERLAEWGTLVGNQLRKILSPPYDRYALYLYVGKHYADQIAANAPDEVVVYRPLQHLGQGAQTKYCLEMSKRPIPPQKKAVWVTREKDDLRACVVTFRVSDRSFAYTDTLEEVLRIPKQELFKFTEQALRIEQLREVIIQTRQQQWELLDRLEPFYS